MLLTRSHSQLQPSWPLRLVAVLCLGLMLLLIWLAADPAAHQALHGRVAGGEAAGHHAGCDHESGETGLPADDAGCVITQFLAGATDLVVLVLLLLFFTRRQLAVRVVPPDWRPRPSDFAWHAPSCGPPRLA